MQQRAAGHQGTVMWQRIQRDRAHTEKPVKYAHIVAIGGITLQDWHNIGHQRRDARRTRTDNARHQGTSAPAEHIRIDIGITYPGQHLLIEGCQRHHCTETAHDSITYDNKC